MHTVTVAPHRDNGAPACNPLLEAALRYAAKRWFVLPLHTPKGGRCSCLKPDCTSIGKHPRNYNGSNGASTDEAKIRQWWGKWQDANVGIATGARSSIFVLDVDGDAGEASLKALERLPTTLRANSGRTGATGKRNSFHLYFKCPAGSNLRNGVATLGRGLDIRSDGGYVVAAPSLHKSGLMYEWLDEGSEIATAPAWLIAKVSKTVPEPVHTSGASFLYEGQRNVVLHRLAVGWRRTDGATQDELTARLRGLNMRRCRPPLPDRDVATIAWSAAKQPPGSLDPLGLAWEDAKAEGHYYAWDKFLALVRHLHKQRPEDTLLLPVERIGKLIGCDHTLVSRFRRKAVADGLIQEVERYVAHELATRFKVLRAPLPDLVSH